MTANGPSVTNPALAAVVSLDTAVPCVVAAFERHLAAAKRGEYVAFALVVCTSDGGTATEHTNGGKVNALRGATAYLMYRLNQWTEKSP